MYWYNTYACCETREQSTTAIPAKRLNRKEDKGLKKEKKWEKVEPNIDQRWQIQDMGTYCTNLPCWLCTCEQHRNTGSWYPLSQEGSTWRGIWRSVPPRDWTETLLAAPWSAGSSKVTRAGLRLERAGKTNNYPPIFSVGSSSYIITL